MKMKKKIALLLALSMTVAMTACGGTNNTPASSEVKESESVAVSQEKQESVPVNEEKEPVTITLYPADANLTSGKVG